MTSTTRREIKHFSSLPHIWWGAKTLAGQRRYDRRFELFKKICNPSKNSKILEIGCGDGEFTKRLIILPSKIVAQDLTPKVIKKAKIRFKQKNVKFEIGNAESLNYKNNSFDIVCGISILHHINLRKALKEARRVLKPNGQIFFSEPNLLNPVIYAGLNLSFLRKRMEYSPDEKALLRWQSRDLLKEIGFRKINVFNYDFLHPSTPPFLIKYIEHLSNIFDKKPLIKEISGSLIINAKK